MLASFLIKAQPLDLSPQGEFEKLDFTLPALLTAAIKLVLVVAAILFFFMLVIGGIRWIASGGDKAQTEAARSQITAALVGLVIVFAAWAISALINTLFGVDIIGTLNIPSI